VPIGNGGVGAVSSGLLGGIGLDLMLAVFAPDDEPNRGRGGVAEGHWRPAVGLHRRLWRAVALGGSSLGGGRGSRGFGGSIFARIALSG